MRLWILVLAALPVVVCAERPNMSLADYLARKKLLSAEHRGAWVACGVNPSVDRDICLAEAVGADWIAKADLEVAYRSTPRSRFEASAARAQAIFWVARERCTDIARAIREVCLEDADATLVGALAGAKAQMKAAEAARAVDDMCADATAAGLQGSGCRPATAPVARQPVPQRQTRRPR
jgi:hypothetical protein